jgi:regulator of extracellular matrix RemA (YlzA/DUF370 family)
VDETRAEGRRRRAGGRGARSPGPALEAGPPALPALRLLNVGYGNFVLTSRVVAILSAQSKPVQRLRKEAETRVKLLDATQGRKTRCLVVLDDDHIVLSALNPETMAARLVAGEPAAAEPGSP